MARARRAPASPICSTRRDRVVLVEPGACATGRSSSLDEEAALAERLATTWGLDDGRRRRSAMPRLHLGFDRLLARTAGQGRVAARRRREPATRSRCRPRAGRRCSATPPALARRFGELAARGLPRSSSAPTAAAAPSASRRCSTARASPSTCSSTSRRSGRDVELRRPGVHVVVAPLDRGASSRRLEARRRRRARPHRAAPAAPRAAAAAAGRRGVLRRPRAGRATSSTTCTASPATAAWSRGRSAAPSATTCCSSTAAATGSTCPRTRSTPSRPTPAASSRRSTGWAAASGSASRPGSRQAVREVAQELVVLYRRRLASPGPRLRARHALAGRARAGLPLSRDPRPAAGDRRGEGRHGARRRRWTASSAATSASARPRSRCGRSSRRCRTASRRRCSCRRRCSPSSTSRPSPSATRPTRSASRCSRASSPPREARKVVDGPRRRLGRRRHRHPPPARRRRRLQGPRSARRRRGAALRRLATRRR